MKAKTKDQDKTGNEKQGGGGTQETVDDFQLRGGPIDGEFTTSVS